MVRDTGALVLAVRPPAWPPAGPAPESPRTALTFPLPVVTFCVRTVAAAGVVQVSGSTEDFSLHQLTSTEPAVLTGTVGVVAADVVVSTPATCDAVTEDAPDGLR